MEEFQIPTQVPNLIKKKHISDCNSNHLDRPNSTPSLSLSTKGVPPRLRRRRTKLLFRKTSAISNSNSVSDKVREDDWVCNHTPKQRLVQFAEISQAKTKGKKRTEVTFATLLLR